MISALIITGSEDQYIENCLKSIKWVEEIIVVANQEANEETIRIAKKYTSKIIRLKVEGFDDWRNRAAAEASGDWLLYIDPDERMLLPLKEEILKIQNERNCSAYAISRRNIIFGKEERYPAFWPDRMIRLFYKKDFDRWIGKVHEHPVFKGRLGYTKNPLLHLTHRNLDQVILKSLNWSKIDARLRLDGSHPKITRWRLLRILFTELFEQGIKRGGFFAGTVGTIDSLLQTISMIMTYVRLWEMQQTKALPEIYQDIDNKLVENNFKF